MDSLLLDLEAFYEDLHSHPELSMYETRAAGLAAASPLWLRGRIPVVAGDGFEYEVRNRVTLCRCGQSKNKPFCDGTHASIKFSDE